MRDQRTLDWFEYQKLRDRIRVNTEYSTSFLRKRIAELEKEHSDFSAYYELRKDHNT